MGVVRARQGLIDTSMTSFALDNARARGLSEFNPMKRSGEAHEVANLALFLASDEAAYVSGQALAVDGGLSSSHPPLYLQRRT